MVAGAARRGAGAVCHTSGASTRRCGSRLTVALSRCWAVSAQPARLGSSARSAGVQHLLDDGTFKHAFNPVTACTNLSSAEMFVHHQRRMTRAMSLADTDGWQRPPSGSAHRNTHPHPSSAQHSKRGNTHHHRHSARTRPALQLSAQWSVAVGAAPSPQALLVALGRAARRRPAAGLPGLLSRRLRHHSRADPHVSRGLGEVRR